MCFSFAYFTAALRHGESPAGTGVRLPSVHVSLQSGLGSHTDTSMPSAVAFSFDIESRMQEHVVRDISREYNVSIRRCQRAAKTIQKQYRNYRVAKRVRDLRMARRSGMFRRASEADLIDLPPISPFRKAHSQSQLQVVVERSESPPQSASDGGVTDDNQSVNGMDSLQSTIQTVMLDDLVGKITGRSSPTGYAADESSTNSTASLESLASTSESLPPNFVGNREMKAMLSGRLSQPILDTPPSSVVSHDSVLEQRHSMISLESHASMTEPPPTNFGRRPSIVYEVRNTDLAESKIRKQRKLRIGITHFNQ